MKKKELAIELSLCSYGRDVDVFSSKHNLLTIDQKIEKAFPGVPRNKLRIHLKRTPYFAPWRRGADSTPEKFYLVITRA